LPFLSVGDIAVSGRRGFVRCLGAVLAATYSEPFQGGRTLCNWSKDFCTLRSFVFFLREQHPNGRLDMITIPTADNLNSEPHCLFADADGHVALEIGLVKDQESD
jgi:hypothetical protein